MRTLVKYPERFKGKKLVFHNSVTSEIPLGFGTSLIENDTHVLVTWREDPDHLRCSVGYKGFDKMRKSNFPNLTLVDIGKGVLPLFSLEGLKYCSCAQSSGKGMGRGTNEISVFFPAESYLHQVLGFLVNKLE